MSDRLALTGFKHDILCLQVRMNDVMAIEERQCLRNLNDDFLQFVLIVSYDIQQVSIVNLQNNIDITL